MKKIYLSLLALCGTLTLSAQIVVSVEAPVALEGNYTFTNATTGWGCPDLLIPANAVLDTAAFAYDATVGDSLACDVVVNTSEVTGKIAVVYRGDCNFSLKALNAQNAGAVAVIIINNIAGPPVAMGAGTYGAQVTIPTVMISESDGALLRPEIEAGNVVVFIGNKAGLYNDDLGFYAADCRTARASANPKQVSASASEFLVQPACWVHNYGNNDQTGVTVTANVDLNGSSVYSQTSAPADIVSGDSAFFTLPDFTQGTWDGFYTLSYAINMAAVDEYDNDNHYQASFLIDSLVAYASVDEATKLPIGGAHYRSSTATTSFTTCVHFRDANASRMAAVGVYTSGSGGANGTMEGEYLEASAYQWDDVFTGISDAAFAYDNLNQIMTGEYSYTADLDGQTIFIPFDSPVMMEDDVRYLFCVTTYSVDVFLGYDTDLDYDENITLDDQPVCPISSDGTWYALGFGTDVTSAVGVHMANFDVGVDENAAVQVVNAYPNPATDRVWLSVGGLSGTGDLRIRNAMGQQVGARRLALGSSSAMDMDVSDLANGTYLFELRDASGKLRSFRVVVAR